MFLRITMLLTFVMLTPFATAKEPVMNESTKNPVVIFETNLGNIHIELYPEKAPITVQNFIAYVQDGFYEGTIFHRVIPNFVVQGGGFDENFQQKKTRENIKNEADNGLKNLRGSLSMARTPNPDSASSQFFINLKDNDFLDFKSKTQQGWGYAVFAQVIEGMDVVDAMAAKPTGNRGMHQDVPKENIMILRAYLQE
jgi:cyclophilin family peptidyl-prolyl cis-trans isomerase